MALHVHGLVVKQPGASLILSGEQTIEVRSRRTHYRGAFILSVAGRPADMPLAGLVVAVCELVDCRTLADTPANRELAPGSWRSPAYAWQIRVVHKLRRVGRVRGLLGLYRLPLDGLPDELATDGGLVGRLHLLCRCTPPESGAP